MATNTPATPMTMRAWHYKQYGPLDEVLEEGELPLPDVGADQVLVKVLAAALNPVDYKRRLGYFRHTDSELPHIPGYDLAGVVVKVGSQVKELREGDEVYGDLSEHALQRPQRFGSLAEYTAVEEKLLARKPSNLSFAEAASLPLAVLTAKEGFERANFQPNQTVLILAGAGGVGSLAIQLAKVVFGASLVATTASTTKVDFVKSLGADVIIDYTCSTYYDLPNKYDFVFDCVGDSANASKAVKEGGVVLTIVDFNALPPAVCYVLTSSGASLAELNPFLESGQLKPIIDPNTGPFPFSNVKDAFKHLEAGKAVGKIVIFPIHNQ
eukprot:c15451_g1_i1 orf=164-1138(+)